MFKKILYAVMVVIIVSGAAFSYKKVDFGRKIGMLFQMSFGRANNMGGPAGRPPMGGDMEDGQRTGFRPGGERDRLPLAEGGFQGRPQRDWNMERGQRPDFPRTSKRGGRIPQGMGRGPGHGEIISLRYVIPYTFLLAFFIMITRFIEVFIKRVFFIKL